MIDAVQSAMQSAVHGAVDSPDWGMVSAMGWTAIVLSIVLVAAVTAFIVVVIRFLLHQMRHADDRDRDPGAGRPESARSRGADPRNGRDGPGVRYQGARTPPYSAAPVPPENPHSPPTPALGTPQVRRIR